MIEVALAVPLRRDRVLVARRDPRQHLGGLWEFPGGKIEAGESPDAAASRELAEETGLVAGGLEPLLTLVHEFSDRTVRFHVFLAREPRGDVGLSEGREWGWKSLAELERIEMPEANRPMLQALRERMPRPHGGS